MQGVFFNYLQRLLTSYVKHLFVPVAECGYRDRLRVHFLAFRHQGFPGEAEV